MSFTAAGIEWIDSHEGAARFGFSTSRAFREWAIRCEFPSRIKPGFTRLRLWDAAAIDRSFHVESTPKKSEEQRTRTA